MIALLALLASGSPAGAAVLMCEGAVKDGWVASDDAAYMRWELLQNFKMAVDQVHAMERLFAAFKAAGLTVVVPLVPPRPMADPGSIPAGERPYDRAHVLRQYRALVSWMDGHGIEAIDLSDEAMSAWGGDRPFFGPFDDHWLPAGARVAAGRVAEALRGVPALEEGTRVAWNTRVEDTLPGHTALFKRCGEGFGEATRTIYATRRRQEVGLLDELPPPSAVAVGTSQSGPNSNFVGFLRESLERDITAYVVPGGGALAGLARWLFTDTDPAARPRLVIWELVMVHLFSVPSEAPAIRESEFFRELIPAVAGDCGGAALAEGTSADGVLLRVPARVQAQGDGYYLVFSGPLPVEFELQLRHADGDDRHRFQAFDRMGAVPARFLSLAPERSERLSLVRARGRFPDGVSTRLCAR